MRAVPFLVFVACVLPLIGVKANFPELLQAVSPGFARSAPGRRLIQRFAGGRSPGWEGRLARGLQSPEYWRIGVEVQRGLRLTSEVVASYQRHNQLIHLPSYQQAQLNSILGVSAVYGWLKRANTQISICSEELARAEVPKAADMDERDRVWHRNFELRQSDALEGTFQYLDSTPIFLSDSLIVMQLPHEIRYFSPPLGEKFELSFKHATQRLFVGYQDKVQFADGHWHRDRAIAVINPEGEITHRVNGLVEHSLKHWRVNAHGVFVTTTFSQHEWESRGDEIIIIHREHGKVSRHRPKKPLSDARFRIKPSLLPDGQFVVVRGFTQKQLYTQGTEIGGETHIFDAHGDLLMVHAPKGYDWENGVNFPGRFRQAAEYQDGVIVVTSEPYGKAAGFDAASGLVGLGLFGPFGLMMGAEDEVWVEGARYEFRFLGEDQVEWRIVRPEEGDPPWPLKTVDGGDD